MIIVGFLAWRSLEPSFMSNGSPAQPGSKGLFWKQPEQKTALAGRTLVLINNGDYMHPKLSPDSRVLAYAEVAVEKETNNLYTQIQLYNLRTQEKSTLMGWRGFQKVWL